MISYFQYSFTESKFIIPRKRSYIFNTTSNNSQSHSQNMFIIYVIDLSTKNKMERRGSYFYKNQKHRWFEKEKQNEFFKYLISEIPNFSYMAFIRKCSMFRPSTPLNHYSNFHYFCLFFNQKQVITQALTIFIRIKINKSWSSNEARQLMIH